MYRGTTRHVSLSLGYYESDVDVKTEDIAEELGVHQSTVWEHLKKAENTILTTIGQQLFVDSSTQPEAGLPAIS